MNLKMFTIALLTSTLPLTLSAGLAKISLDKGDFISAKKISRDGETIVSVKLSKSGKAKFRKLNASSVGEEVHSEID